MKCPTCDAPTKVLETTQPGDRGRTRRRLVCKGPRPHRFTTEEELVGWRLEKDVHIRHSGDERLQPEPFDRDRLLYDVEQATLGRLSGAQIVNVVEKSIAHLNATVVPKASPLRQDELAQIVKPDQLATAIWDYEVREAVEYQLRATNRIAHILYVLSFIGRPVSGTYITQTKRKPGWRTVEPFLEWLFVIYPDLAEPLPERPDVETHRWRPVKPPSHPSRVVKREKPLQRDVNASKSGGSGGVVDFLESRFERSIEAAMLGRPDARKRSRAIASWVLNDLVGQNIVHSTQLAVGVLDCLRRVDDIAYLRVAIQLKDFRAVRDIKAEAMGLITHPSDRLQFNLEGSASPGPVRGTSNEKANLSNANTLEMIHGSYARFLSTVAEVHEQMRNEARRLIEAEAAARAEAIGAVLTDANLTQRRYEVVLVADQETTDCVYTCLQQLREIRDALASGADPDDYHVPRREYGQSIRALQTAMKRHIELLSLRHRSSR